MNEQRSNSIWNGLSAMLLLVTGAAVAFGFVQIRYAKAVADLELARRRDAESRVGADRAATDLMLKVRKLEQRVHELEDENNNLRARLEPAE